MSKYFHFHSFILILTLCVSCREIHKSSINRDLLKVKVQGADIKTKINFYFLENKRLPSTLQEIGISEKFILDSGQAYTWTYNLLDKYDKCQLITDSKVEGYYVYLNRYGNIKASSSMPAVSEFTWIINHKGTDKIPPDNNPLEIKPK